MYMTYKEHVERILEEKKINQEDLAKKMGVKQATVSQYISGNPTLGTLRKMATALDVSVGDLLGEIAPLKHKDGYVYIPIMSIEASAGSGTDTPRADVEDMFAIKEEDFKMEFGNVSPEKLEIISVRGDSMEPRLRDKDKVIVNGLDKEPREGVFVIWFEGLQYVKRLQKIKGGWRLKSDNPSYDPIDVKEHDEIKVQGRVIGAVMVRRV
jgi:phage repressor protein C with HTH and peptisase S24 domain